MGLARYPVEFRVLGPVEIWVGDQPVEVGPPQQRLLLAALAVDAGRPVSAESLIDRVWDDAPDGARRTLHVLLARLRRIVERAAGGGTAPALARRSGGYLLQAGPDRVDAQQAERLAREAGQPGRDPAARTVLLREALVRFRGEPLAGLPGRWAARTREVWQDRQVATAVAWARAELAAGDPAGDPAGVTGPLTALAGEYPLDESLAAVLVRALAAAGRQADALNHFAAVRRRLATELGADPGPELQAAHRAALRAGREPAATGRPAGRRVPAHLPADVEPFTGRQDELSVLDALLDAGREGGQAPTAMPIAAVSGTAGVGKTALAVHWAHRARDRFPDGQLYLNLRGYDPEQPVAAGDALAVLLEALGVASRDIPADPDARSARYRTETAGRRMLVLLDNAAAVDQVRPLLPGDPSCTVVVTSRDSLSGLVALHGARRLELELLPLPDAVALLRRLVGARVDADPGASVAFAGQCARLPLALRVAAELAAARPDVSLADLVAEMADQRGRWDLLRAGDDPRGEVDAVFSWSVRHLPPAASRAFRLCGLHPGPDLDGYAVAALTGADLPGSRRLLDLLVRAHLVEPTGHGRYGMHDLLRAYAADLAGREDSAEDRTAALTRLTAYYTAAAATAMDRLHPAEARRRPAAPPAPTPVPALADSATARAWLVAEWSSLVAVTVHAADHGRPEYAVTLARLLFRRLLNGHYTDAVLVFTHAGEAARQAGDAIGEGWALVGLGLAQTEAGAYRHAAAGHHRRALELFQRAGDLGGEAMAVFGVGLADQWNGEFTRAAGHYRRALRLFEREGDPVGQATALVYLGELARHGGRYRTAVEHHRRALDLHRQAGNTNGAANALLCLGFVEQRQGRHRSAAEHMKEALAAFDRLGNRSGEVDALTGLGDALTRLGQPEEAASHHRRALALAGESGMPEGQAYALNGLGDATAAAGCPAEARSHYEAALSVAVASGIGICRANAEAGLGHVHRALGDLDRARTHLQRAADLYASLGMPDADHIRDHLTTLDTHPEQKPDN